VSGGVTPLPTSATPLPERSGTQVAAPKTVVAGAVIGGPSTVVLKPGAATPEAAPAALPGEKKRPGWLIPVIGLALLAVAVVLFAALSGQGAGPSASPTAQATSSQIVPSVTSVTSEAASTPTAAPITSKLLSLKKETELRNKAGSDPTAQIEGLLPAGVQFFVKARTDDAAWVRIETPDGVTGWIDAAATGLTLEELQELRAATTLTRLTDTPTPTEVPTDIPTPTLAPTQTRTPAPTRTLGPTKPPVTPKPATPTNAPPSPTTAAVTEPLGSGFTFQFCTVDGDNYTCNVNVWGSGGDGQYHFALENPDTGNWDEKTGGAANYLMRSRRCKIKTQQLRVWDESGNHMELNLTMDPNVLDPAIFPGGAGCPPL